MLLITKTTTAVRCDKRFALCLTAGFCLVVVTLAAEMPAVPLAQLPPNCWTVTDPVASSTAFQLVDGSAVQSTFAMTRAACDSIGGSVVEPMPRYAEAPALWSGLVCDTGMSGLPPYSLSGTAHPTTPLCNSTSATFDATGTPTTVTSLVGLCQRPLLPQRGEVVQWGPIPSSPMLWAAYFPYPMNRTSAKSVCSRLRGGSLGFIPYSGNISYVWSALDANTATDAGAAVNGAGTPSPCSATSTAGMWFAYNGMSDVPDATSYLTSGMSLLTMIPPSNTTEYLLTLNATTRSAPQFTLTPSGVLAPFLCTGVLVQVAVTLNSTTLDPLQPLTEQQPFIEVSIASSVVTQTPSGYVRVYLQTSDGTLALPLNNYVEFVAGSGVLTYRTPLVPTSGNTGIVRVTAMVDERDSDYAVITSITNGTVNVTTLTASSAAGPVLSFKGTAPASLSVPSNVTVAMRITVANSLSDMYIPINSSDPGTVFASPLYFAKGSTSGSFTLTALQSTSSTVTIACPQMAMDFGGIVGMASIGCFQPFSLSVSSGPSLTLVTNPNAILDPVNQPLVTGIWYTITRSSIPLRVTATLGVCADLVTVSPAVVDMVTTAGPFVYFSLRLTGVPFAANRMTCSIHFTPNVTGIMMSAPTDLTFVVQQQQEIKPTYFPRLVDTRSGSNYVWSMLIPVPTDVSSLWLQLPTTIFSPQLSPFRPSTSGSVWNATMPISTVRLSTKDRWGTTSIIQLSCTILPTLCSFLPAPQQPIGSVNITQLASNLPFQLMPLWVSDAVVGRPITFTVQVLQLDVPAVGNFTIISTPAGGTAVITSAAALTAADFTASCLSSSYRCANFTVTFTAPITLLGSVTVTANWLPSLSNATQLTTVVNVTTGAVSYQLVLQPLDATDPTSTRQSYFVRPNVSLDDGYLTLTMTSPQKVTMSPTTLRWGAGDVTPTVLTLDFATTGPNSLVFNQRCFAAWCPFANVSWGMSFTISSSILNITNYPSSVVVNRTSGPVSFTADYSLPSDSTLSTVTCTPTIAYRQDVPFAFLRYVAVPSHVSVDAGYNVTVVFTLYADGNPIVVPSFTFGCVGLLAVALISQGAPVTIVQLSAVLVASLSSVVMLPGTNVTATCGIDTLLNLPQPVTFSLTLSTATSQWSLQQTTSRLTMAYTFPLASAGSVSLLCAVVDALTHVAVTTNANASAVGVVLPSPRPALASPVALWPSFSTTASVTWTVTLPTKDVLQPTAFNVVNPSYAGALNASTATTTGIYTKANFPISTSPPVSNNSAFTMLAVAAGPITTTSATSAMVRIRPAIGASATASVSSIPAGGNFTIQLRVGVPPLSFGAATVVLASVGSVPVNITPSQFQCNATAVGRCQGVRTVFVSTAATTLVAAKIRVSISGNNGLYTSVNNVNIQVVTPRAFSSTRTKRSKSASSDLSHSETYTSSRTAELPTQSSSLSMTKSPSSITRTASLTWTTSSAMKHGHVRTITDANRTLTLTVSPSLTLSATKMKTATAPSRTWSGQATVTAHRDSITPCASISPSMTHTLVAVPLTFDPLPVLMPVEAKQISVAAVSSVAATGALASAPGAALQAARALSVLALSDCYFKHDTPLAFPLSAWPGFIIGSTMGGYYRGAVVANIFTLLGLGVLGFVLAAVVGRVVIATTDATSQQRIAAGMATLKYPGLLVIPGGLLLCGLSVSTVATAVHGDQRSLDVPIAVFGALCVIAYIVSCWHVAMVIPRRYATEREPCANPNLMTRIFGEDEPLWEARRATADDPVPPLHVLGAWGPIFAKYRGDARWYYSFDAFLTVCVGSAQGTMPSRQAECIGAIGAVLGISLIALASALVMRPNDTWSKNAILVLTSLLTVLAAGCVLAGILLNRTGIVATGQTLAAGAGYLSAAAMLLTVGRFAIQQGKAFRTAAANEKDFAQHARTSAMLITPDLSVYPDMEEVSMKLLQGEERPPSPSPPPSELRGIDLSPTPTDDNETPSAHHSMLLLNDANSVHGPIHGSAPWRVATRTEEGQRLYKELEALLHAGKPSAGRDIWNADGGEDDDGTDLDSLLIAPPHPLQKDGDGNRVVIPF